MIHIFAHKENNGNKYAKNIRCQCIKFSHPGDQKPGIHAPMP